MNLPAVIARRKREAKERAGLLKRVDVLESLLSAKDSVHPPGCYCAIKARNPKHHALDCPYRLIRELLSDVQRALPTGDERAK